MITNIIKNYINKRVFKMLDDLILSVSELTDAVVDINDRTTNLEKIVVKSAKPKYVTKNGKVELA